MTESRSGRTRDDGHDSLDEHIRLPFSILPLWCLAGESEDTSVDENILPCMTLVLIVSFYNGSLLPQAMTCSVVRKHPKCRSDDPIPLAGHGIS